MHIHLLPLHFSSLHDCLSHTHYFLIICIPYSDYLYSVFCMQALRCSTRIGQTGNCREIRKRSSKRMEKVRIVDTHFLILVLLSLFSQQLLLTILNFEFIKLWRVMNNLGRLIHLSILLFSPFADITFPSSFFFCPPYFLPIHYCIFHERIRLRQINFISFCSHCMILMEKLTAMPQIEIF